jgi:transcriptional regulator with XRE-family HTH domain
MNSFSKTMRFSRKLKGIRQDAFAKKVGLSRVTVSRYENGKVAVKLCHALKIAAELDFSLDALKDS